MNEVLKTKKVNLFGHDYDVFFDSCCTNTSKRTLYIELLNICNAKCSFCSSSCNLKITPKILDLNFAKEVIIELLNKNIIDKISLTGGEPLIYPYLKDLLDFLDSLLDRGLNFYAITTNGILLEKQINLLEDSKVKYINISRHHYDQEKNDKIFGIKTKTLKELKEIIISSNKEYRLNVTITEEFNTKEDIIEYIKFAKNIGVRNILIRKEYKNGKKVLFSSAKQMFYYFYTSKPKEVVPLKKMYVTDYKTKELIEATEAFYVFGSNVVSFSGDDLIPFASYEDAKKFADYNSASRIFEFSKINKKLIDYLD